MPPVSCAAAPAAIAQAVPTSPWQPTSAPEIEALDFTIFPINPAVASALIIFSSLILYCSWLIFKTAGKIPQEPHVGAVTTSPPDAFCSETAVHMQIFYL